MATEPHSVAVVACRTQHQRDGTAARSVTQWKCDRRRIVRDECASRVWCGVTRDASVCGRPASVSYRLTQLLSVCAEHPILVAIEVIAAHRDGWSLACSTTIRTARSRISVENRDRYGMTPFSHEMEPPGISDHSPGHGAAPSTRAPAIRATARAPCPSAHAPPVT
jgi:hypothetical protein